MIERVWRGWTTAEDAPAYEELLRTEILPDIRARGVEGYRGVRLLRRELESEVEFCTIMTFDDIESVRAFAGSDYETAYVPESARRVLKRFDAAAKHYEVRERRVY